MIKSLADFALSFRMVNLPNYHSYNLTSWPYYEGRKLASVVTRLDVAGLDLMGKLLQPDPAKRCTAKEAMRHPYFSDLTEQIQTDNEGDTDLLT